MDEIRLDAPTEVVELKDGRIESYTLRPEDVGLTLQDRSVLNELTADSTESSLALVRQSLTEPDCLAAEIVTLNAGAAIYVAGIATSLKNGVVMAQDAVASGLAKERLDELVRISRLMGEA